MHAIVVDPAGTPADMHWRAVDAPRPGPGEVLVDVAASAVNRADLLQRQGNYPVPPGSTPIMGLECSGIISAVGAGVTTHQVGDQVTALLGGGGYAEQVAVPVGQVMSLPAGLTLIQGAALPEVACTVWSNIVMTSHLQQGEWLLIHGGGSGIGTIAIQIGRALGARIAVTAGSSGKLESCERLGAEVLINYREQDFVEVMRDVTGGRGVDVILDNMGAKYLARNIEVLGRNGRLDIIGLQGGRSAELDLNAILRKNVTIHARALRSRPLDEKAEICGQVEETVWPWIEAGLVAPVIGAVVPMREAGQAHRMLEAGEVTGKIVLENA